MSAGVCGIVGVYVCNCVCMNTLVDYKQALAILSFMRQLV